MRILAPDPADVVPLWRNLSKEPLVASGSWIYAFGIEPGESLHDEAERIDECDMTSRGRCPSYPRLRGPFERVYKEGFSLSIILFLSYINNNFKTSRLQTHTHTLNQTNKLQTISKMESIKVSSLLSIPPSPCLLQLDWELHLLPPSSISSPY